MKNDFFTPFNGYKALIHVPEWRKIMETGEITYPVDVSIDMAAMCPLSCVWCNSRNIRGKNILMSEATISKVIDLVRIGFFRHTCIGGGGESLCNPNAGYLIEEVSKYAQIGLITNGIYINKFVPQLMSARWIGISLDAATPKTFERLKGQDLFKKIISNISLLVKAGHKNIGVKYLIWPGNEKEIFEACKLTKDLGVYRFEVRPADLSWTELRKKDRVLFDDEKQKIAKEQIQKCMELENSDFSVHCRMQNFNNDFSRKVEYHNCYAQYFNCIFQANGIVSFCLDKREDPKTFLCEIKDLPQAWNSKKHKDIELDIKDCPRCSFSVCNVIFERMVLQDDMESGFL